VTVCSSDEHRVSTTKQGNGKKAERDRETHQILDPHVRPMLVQLHPNHRYPRLLLLLLQPLLFLHLSLLDLLRRRILSLLRRLRRRNVDFHLGCRCGRRSGRSSGRRCREVFRADELDLAEVRVEEGDETVEAGREEVGFCVLGTVAARFGFEEERVGRRGRRRLGVGVRVVVVVVMRSVGSRFCTMEEG
jgi:hypothetical protein